MLSNEVKEWLVEYKGLSNAEINTFAVTLAVNDKLIIDIFALFETLPYSGQELDPVCHQLYEFYRSKEEKLKLFSLQFVASLVCLYLRCLGNYNKKICGGVETFLLGVYNLEIVKLDGSPIVESFCIPSISKASIYHESRIPGVTEPLTEHALRSLNPSQSLWRCGPYSQHERFNAQNRFCILTFIMQRYNIHIDNFHNQALDAVCKAAIILSSTGFIQKQESKESSQPRISVSPSLLIEYMVAVYFAMFHGHHMNALKAVEATHNLSSFELYTDVLLITNAILHSHLRGNLRFEALDVSIGAQKTSHALKNTITNASFKAKKLPDDIDFVEVDESNKLPTVDEDQESHITKALRKAKLMSIGAKLGGDKNKNRDNMRRDSDTPSLKSSSGVEIAESVGVAVRNPSGGGKIVVDVLEMQPIRSRGNEDSSDGGGSSRNSYAEKGGAGKQIKVSSSPIVFSKKSGVMQQDPFSSSGLSKMNSDSSPKTSLAYTSSASLSSNAVNGKASSGSSSVISSTNSIISSVRAPSQYKASSSASPHSPRAQSEGPSRDGPKLISVKLPPSSSPSLLLSPSFPNSHDPGLHSNLSEPALTHHSSCGSPSPSSTHSIPSDALSNSTSKSAINSLINQTTCSTNL